MSLSVYKCLFVCSDEVGGRGIKKILSKEPSTTFKEVGRQFITVFKRRASKKTKEELTDTHQINKKMLHKPLYYQIFTTKVVN